MKILMITPYVPYPPSSGGQIRTYNLLKYLSQKNKITLICLYKFSQEKKFYDNLKPFCEKIYFCKRSEHPWALKNILKTGFSLYPFLIVRNFSQEAKKILYQILKNDSFDVIHAETFYVMPHLPKVNIPVLLVEQTIEYLVYQHFINSLTLPIRIMLQIDIFKLKYWERFYWRKADQVATVSESDKKIIHHLEPKINPVIIPNCASDEMIVEKPLKKKLDPPILLFQGNFLWLQNTEAAKFLIQKINPLLEKKIKNYRIIIAGQFATQKLSYKNLSPQIKIIDIPVNDINLTKKLYFDSTIFIAPIFGPGGTRLKILAAMASGTPVIATPTGVSGLDVKNGKDVLIANLPEEFIEKVILILKDKKLYKKIQTNAHQLVLEKYHWKKVSQDLEKRYKFLKKNKK